jgi:hypothetical protein
MLDYNQLQARLATEFYTSLITGVAGFISSNLLETVCKLNQCLLGYVPMHQPAKSIAQAMPWYLAEKR